MCLPLAAGGVAISGMQAAALALSVATTVAANTQKRKAAEAQAKALQDNYNAQMNLVGQQQGQINAGAQQKESELARQVNAERARLATVAGEYGVSGNTLDRLNTELFSRQADGLGAIDYNRNNALAQTNANALGLRADAQTKVNGLDYGPGWLGTGLQIMGLGLNAFSQGTSMPDSNYTGVLKEPTNGK